MASLDANKVIDHVRQSYEKFQHSKSNLDVSMQYFSDGLPRKKYFQSILVLYRSDSEIGIRIRERENYCMYGLHRGDSAVLFHSGLYEESQEWRFDDAILLAPEMESRTGERSHAWPVDGNIDLHHLGTWLNRPLCRGEDDLVVGFNATEIDHNTIQLEGENDLGQGTVLIDKNFWLPRKIEWVQFSDSRLWGNNDKKVSEIVFEKEDEDATWPSSGWVEKVSHVVSYSFDDQEKSINSWTHKQDYFCSDGTKVSVNMRGTVSDLSRVEDVDIFDCFDVAKPPEKMDAYAMHAPKLRYQWNGNWIVPVEDNVSDLNS